MSPTKEENEFDVVVPEVKKPTKVHILKNTLGKDVKPEDYFYAEVGSKSVVPSSFNEVCGQPVEREDLVELFNNIFDVKDNVLFYKTVDKEVYIIIIPLKYSTTVGRMHESVNGDFQKHAISFVAEGSVNNDSLKMKLKRILPFVDFTKK